MNKSIDPNIGIEGGPLGSLLLFLICNIHKRVTKHRNNSKNIFVLKFYLKTIFVFTLYTMKPVYSKSIFSIVTLCCKRLSEQWSWKQKTCKSLSFYHLIFVSFTSIIMTFFIIYVSSVFHFDFKWMWDSCNSSTKIVNAEFIFCFFKCNSLHHSYKEQKHFIFGQ